MANSDKEDAERYRILRRDAWHFMVRVRPEVEGPYDGGCNSWPAMSVTALDDAIDSWARNPTFGIARR